MRFRSDFLSSAGDLIAKSFWMGFGRSYANTAGSIRGS
jgi:hypothetical protein